MKNQHQPCTLWGSAVVSLESLWYVCFTYILAYLHIFTLSHFHTCILAYLFTFQLACLHTCILAYLYTYILAYLLICIPDYLHSCIHRTFYWIRYHFYESGVPPYSVLVGGTVPPNSVLFGGTDHDTKLFCLLMITFWTHNPLICFFYNWTFPTLDIIGQGFNQ